MARKRDRVRGVYTPSKRSVHPARDTIVIANAPALRRISSRALVARSTFPTFSDDLRTWHPERSDRPALKFSGLPAAVVIGRRPRSVGRKAAWPSHAVVFKNPDRVLTCVRRARRREVIFASGRGGKKTRRPKYTWRSKIHCKR